MGHKKTNKKQKHLEEVNVILLDKTQSAMKSSTVISVIF